MRQADGGNMSLYTYVSQEGKPHGVDTIFMNILHGQMASKHSLQLLQHLNLIYELTESKGHRMDLAKLH